MRPECVFGILTLTVVLGSPVFAAEPMEEVVRLDSIRTLQIIVSPSTHAAEVRTFQRACPPLIATHTDSDFEPGQYIVQAGFEQQEAAGASYTVPAEAFPLQFVSAEILFATADATTQTTTEWSFELWQGTPEQGTLMHVFDSDGTILPHLIMPPGTTGTIVQLIIDPGDPEQIFIADNGSHTYSVAFRIEQHNSPGQPCLVPPDQQANAFPTTDMSGVGSQTGNWIDAIDGSFCVCGVGWFNFAQFPSVCTPSGDWVIRSTYIPLECVAATGACCFANGTCQPLTEVDCGTLEGKWSGAQVTCVAADCQPSPGACCVAATGACTEVNEATCLAFGGEFHAEESCATWICFPEGACCLVNGDCTGPVAQDVCDGFGGTFMGHGTDCATTDCPDPTGWCCPEDGSFCSDMSEEQCLAFGAIWGGIGTSCDDASACNASSCDGDVNDSGAVDVDDLLLILSSWGGTGGGDADGDGDVDVDDLLMAIANFGPC